MTQPQQPESEEAARAEIERLNPLLASLGMPYKLALVSPRELVPLEKNARFMKSETFRSLVKNVKRDGALSSLPFCWRDEAGKMHVLSGNHRVKAAAEAGVARILVLYDDRPLSRQERVAIQLSHNALAGEDDPATLKDLWREIEDVGLKFYSGLDDKALQELAKSASAALSEVRLDYRTLWFVLLPEEVERVGSALDEALKKVAGKDPVFLGRVQEFDRLLDAMARLRKKHKIKASAVALLALLDQFEKSEGCESCAGGSQAET